MLASSLLRALKSTLNRPSLGFFPVFSVVFAGNLGNFVDSFMN
jgi:hypothetical protein